ncbi:MAG: hypothetical protein J0H05_16780, partial [Stenotrophomonas acidaminiphila]|nr:hypothetical protein [Stenotrophomonas acidaminiphila]
ICSRTVRRSAPRLNNIIGNRSFRRGNRRPASRAPTPHVARQELPRVITTMNGALSGRAYFTCMNE